MGSKPTFHICDDYVALMDLKPAERTVYMLLRCNAAYGRQGVANHTVHVTAAWFTEMTAHWEKPMPASTARQGLNGLIQKGVLIRLNKPQDGSGFVLAFVADPRGQHDGPMNAFEHAKKVSRRTGVHVYYDRKEDDLPGTPAVTGVRLGARNVPKAAQKSASADAPERDEWSQELDEIKELDELKELVDSESERPDPRPEQRPAVANPSKVHIPAQAGPTADLARLLVQKCHGKGVGGRGLLDGEARRVAEAYAPALDAGWTPARLAGRLASLVSNKIHSIEAFLCSKVDDLGAPPAVNAVADKITVDGKELDLSTYNTWDASSEKGGVTQEAEPAQLSDAGQTKKDRLAELARKTRRY